MPPLPASHVCQTCHGTAPLNMIRYGPYLQDDTNPVAVTIRLITQQNANQLAPGHDQLARVWVPTTNLLLGNDFFFFRVDLAPVTRNYRRNFLELQCLPYHSRSNHIYLRTITDGNPANGPVAMVECMTGSPVNFQGFYSIMSDLMPGNAVNVIPALRQDYNWQHMFARPVNNIDGNESRTFSIKRQYLQNFPPFQGPQHTLEIRRLNPLPWPTSAGAVLPYNNAECVCYRINIPQNAGIVANRPFAHPAADTQLTMRYSVPDAPTNWVPVKVGLRRADLPDDLTWGFVVKPDVSSAAFSYRDWCDLQVMPMRTAHTRANFGVLGESSDNGLTLTNMYVEAGNVVRGEMYDVIGWREVLHDLMFPANPFVGPPTAFQAAQMAAGNPFQPPVELSLVVRRRYDRAIEFGDVRNMPGTFCGPMGVGLVQRRR